MTLACVYLFLTTNLVPLFISFFYQIGSIYEVDILLTNYTYLLTYVPLHVNVI